MNEDTQRVKLFFPWRKRKMDVEALIAAVYKRPIIWDKTNKLHSNRSEVCKAWIEISKELSNEEYQLRKKWKYLRDQFSSEWGKVPPNVPEEAMTTGLASRWQFFPQLLFLRDVLKPRPSLTTVSRCGFSPEDTPSSCAPDAVVKAEIGDQTVTTSDEDYCPNDDDDASEYDEDEVDHERNSRRRKRMSSRIVSNTTTPVEDHKNSRRPNYNDNDNRVLEYLLKRPKLTEVADEPDEDTMFLKSLLPHIRRIPEHRKLRFRCQVLQVVEDFSYPSQPQSTDPDPPVSNGN